MHTEPKLRAEKAKKAKKRGPFGFFETPVCYKIWKKKEKRRGTPWRH